MGSVVALRSVAADDSGLDGLLAQHRVWRGRSDSAVAPLAQATGWAALDAVLPTGGWPEAALTELLLPVDGIGELQLLWPTLARLSQPRDAVIVLVAPPYQPYPPAWHAAGVRLEALQVIETKTPRDGLWAAEQCLRSGACAAVLCWPRQADDRALRRLQVASESGQALGFAFRPMKAGLNPSPAALRIALEGSPRQLRVLKCRGGNPPAWPIPFPDHRGGPLASHPSPEPALLQCHPAPGERPSVPGRPTALPSFPRPAGSGLLRGTRDPSGTDSIPSSADAWNAGAHGIEA